MTHPRETKGSGWKGRSRDLSLSAQTPPVANPAALPASKLTKAADYVAARLRGERLPEHLLPHDIEEHIEAMNYDRSCQAH